MLAVGEDVVLLGKEAAARVDQIDARQPVLRRDLLRAQVLLDRHGIVSPALDGRVVRHDHAFAARHAADAADDRGGMHVAAVHPPGADLAASEDGDPGSSSERTRSRGSILPRAVCLSRAAWSPPTVTMETFCLRSSTRPLMRSAFSRNSAERGLIWLLIRRAPAAS